MALSRLKALEEAHLRDKAAKAQDYKEALTAQVPICMLILGIEVY